MAREHRCEWRTRAEEQDKIIAKLTARLDEVERLLAKADKQIVGPKSERMPTPEDEAKKREEPAPKRGGHVNPEKRKANAAAMAALPTTIVPHPIPEDERHCPSCGGEVQTIGAGDESFEYDWRRGHIVRRRHLVEVGRCPCKQHYARGPAPTRVQEGCTYGPGLLAKLAVDKCADATPIYRIEKAMHRAGIPLARSTLNDLVLLCADVCEPLWKAAFDEMRIDPHVQADETSFRTQQRPKRSFVWTFLSSLYTVYVFSPDRGGDTAKLVLGGTTGSLTVDGHTGYNVVTAVDGRERTGCWSHARRYLFEAWPTAPEARAGLDIILELFLVERAAKSHGIVGTKDHLTLRQRRSFEMLGKMLEWMKDVAPRYEPKSAMGQALRYIQNQWFRLVACVDDPMIPIHNNASEAALRIIALARKNSLFFGNDAAGRRFMILYSLIATCERHGVNPEAYLADVLIRIQDHPKHRVAELLPHRWKESFGTGFAADIGE